MKKIPTIYLRDPENPKYVTEEPHPDCDWVFRGEGRATRKFDGTCVRIAGTGEIFTRRQVKVEGDDFYPDGFVPVETDPNTGKTVGWEPYEQSAFAKFIREALHEQEGTSGPGTYELCGPKINGNPEHLNSHQLIPHGDWRVYHLDWPSGFHGLRRHMSKFTDWEGVVWHHPDGRMAKIKRRDFPA